MNKIQSIENTVSTKFLSNRSDESEIIKLKENGLYQVKSFSNPNTFYVVDLFSGTCTCPHFLVRGANCKHIQAVRVKLSQEAFEQTGVIF